MNESTLQREIMLALSQAGARVFRNNVGMLQDRNGTWVRYGVGNPGGSDIIGWFGPRFLAIEVKTAKGKLSAAQSAFLDAVRRSGGISACCRSVDEALEALK